MPIEYKPHRASSRALAHLDGLLDEALEQTFPASDAVAIDVERESHEREARVPIPAVRWLATVVARGPHRNGASSRAGWGISVGYSDTIETIFLPCRSTINTWPCNSA
jgi:hypothetical protein